jgi:hypothetical protein
MADRVLLISWGTPVQGREERGLEVFNAALGLYGRLQQAGRIEGFDVSLFEPNLGINGFIQIHGSAEQLAAARADEEFQRITIDATLVVENLCLIDGYTNEGVAQQMALYQEAIAKVPQHT